MVNSATLALRNQDATAKQNPRQQQPRQQLLKAQVMMAKQRTNVERKKTQDRDDGSPTQPPAWANSTREGPLPNVDDLRLAPNGVVADSKGRYIRITFTNGFSVSLFPVNINKKQTTPVRDLIATWLTKRLGG